MSDPLLDLFSTIEKRKSTKDKKSYTSKLFKDGEKKIAQKFGPRGERPPEGQNVPWRSLPLSPCPVAVATVGVCRRVRVCTRAGC